MLCEVYLSPSVFSTPPDEALKDYYWNAVLAVLWECAHGCAILGDLRDGELGDHIVEAARAAGAKYGQKLQTLLRGLRVARYSRLIRREPRQETAPLSDEEWDLEAGLSHEQYPFGLAMVRDAAQAESLQGVLGSPAVPIDALWFRTTDEWHHRGTELDLRKPEGLARQARTTLWLAKRVTIVDYMIGDAFADPNRHRRFLTGIVTCLIEWLALGRVRRTEFEISTVGAAPSGDVAAEWKQAVAEVVKKAGCDTSDVRVSLRVHRPAASGKGFPKDRYMLTDIAGMTVGKGFDMLDGTQEEKTTFGLLSRASWNELSALVTGLTPTIPFSSTISLFPAPSV